MSGFRNERILCWLLRRGRHVGKSVADNRRETMGCHFYRYGGGLKLIAFVLESGKMYRVPRTHSSLMMETAGSSETSANIRLQDVESHNVLP
jgi:hypothetical protein